MSTVLSMENIVKSYTDDESVLKDVSLTVQEGESVVIIGSSGSGKSTLLRCVNTLERINSGKIVINDKTLVSTDANGLVSYPSNREIRSICTDTAMVFQHFNLFPHLSCLENITISPVKILKRNKAESIQKAKELLELVGLSSKTNNFPDELSGGQKQRLAIARALAIDPKIMLFDEPTSALDPEITNEVTNVILQLAQQNVTMLIVTHDMAFARNAASKVIFLDNGLIAEQGPPKQIFETPQTDRLKDFLFSFNMKY